MTPSCVICCLNKSLSEFIVEASAGAFLAMIEYSLVLHPMLPKIRFRF